MNLLTSYAWLKEYLSSNLSPEAFAARISLSGPAVEKIIPRDELLQQVVVSRIQKVEAHPQADRLRIVTVDVGQAAPLKIVCGGSNLADQQYVAVGLLGARVKWHGEGEPVTLVLTKIRGIESEGMICAAEEIGLGDLFPKTDEKEILDLTNLTTELNLTPGQSLAEALGIAGDVVMDIEVTTNRPDAMSLMGLAREAGAILNLPFHAVTSPQIPVLRDAPALNVQIEDRAICSRYLAVRIDGVKNGVSPVWMRQRLVSAGVRPISLLVDITNYILLELGQPMHVFDADKLEGGQMRVRPAAAGESMQALDGETYELSPGMLVIADAKRPVAIAGVMGGEATGVSATTTSVILECATFDPVAVRRTARALNLYSDSQSMFEKGLSTESPQQGLARATELFLKLAGGKVTSQVFDSQTSAYTQKEYSLSVAHVRALVGVDLALQEMTGTLERLGFGVYVKDDVLTALVPWWRDHDIEDGRDLVEEIARVHGYANLPSVFPAGISTRPSDPILDVEDTCRTILQGAGFTDVYSYAFVSADQLTKSGCAPEAALRVQNPLATELEYMRPSLIPGLLQVIVDNQERVTNQRYAEIAHVFLPRTPELPEERPMLVAALAGDDQVWKSAKGLAELILERFGIRGARYYPDHQDDAREQWHPGRSMVVAIDGKKLGRVGEIHPRLAADWKLNQRVAMCSLRLEEIMAHAQSSVAYQPVSEFPASKRDIALVMRREVTVERVQQTIAQVAELPTQVEWFDTYMGKGVEEGMKSVAFHLTFQEPTRTLSSEEVEQQVRAILDALAKELGAVVRG